MGAVPGLLMATVSVVLWVVVAWRLPTVRQRGLPRTMWGALAALAAGQSLQVPGLYTAVEHALGRPGVAADLKHLFALLSAAFVRAVVSDLAGRPLGRGRRIGLPAAALALMVLPYLLWPPSALPAALVGRAEFYGPALGVIVPWAAFLAYLSWALGSAALLCWRHRRHAGSAALRRGLTMVTAGTCTGFLYVGLKVVLEAAWSAGDGSRLTALDAAADAAVLGVSVTLCTLGATSEALADRLAAAGSTLRAARSLRRLRPLWTALHAVVPTVVLLPEAGWLSAHDPRSTRLRLVRRVIEIRDGLLHLEPYLPGAARDTARREAADRGLPSNQAEAVAEAAWIGAALQAKATGRRAGGDHRPPPPGGQGFAGETQWLESVARQLERSTSRALGAVLISGLGVEAGPVAGDLKTAGQGSQDVGWRALAPTAANTENGPRSAR